MWSTLPKNKGIIPPEGGWKESTYYIVEVAFSSNNPIHSKIFFSGFIHDGHPSGYNQLFTDRSSRYATIDDVYYMKSLKEIEFAEGMSAP